MKQEFFTKHWTESTEILPDVFREVPHGGISSGRGFTISWQRGPLSSVAECSEPNGAFPEDIIEAVIQYIVFQQNYFPCPENMDALVGLMMAARRLDDPARNRELEAFA